MEEYFKKKYTIGECSGIEVLFKPNFVHLPNTPALKCAIKKHQTRHLARQIKADYHSYFDNSLEISTPSLSIEIWGHVFMEKWVYRVAKMLHNKRFWSFHEKIYSHCKMVDCGERSVDSNRKIWDALSRFYPVFYFFL